MLNTSEKDGIYTCVLFEYIMSTNDSEIIKKFYKRLRDDLNISLMKIFRDSLISEILDYKEKIANIPIYDQLRQKIVSVMIDESISCESENRAEIDNKAIQFWTKTLEENLIIFTKEFYSLLDIFKNNNIKLRKESHDFLNNNVYKNYIKVKYSKVISQEEIYVKCDSQDTNNGIIFELLPNIEKIFEIIQIKEENRKSYEEFKFENYSNSELNNLNDDLNSLLKNELSLELLELHICEVYNSKQVSSEDYETLEKVMNQIKKCLNNNSLISSKYGKAKVECFGSSSNSLWNKTSDIDIVVEFDHEFAIQNDIDQKSNDSFSNVNGKYLNRVEHLTNFNYIEALKDIKSCLSHLALEESICESFNSRVPLLKFIHAETNYDIDISVNDTNGVPNSKLIKLYCEFDQRAHIMITYLRTLFKNAELTHSYQGRMFSSFCLILMIIAFLQNQEEPILPNLQECTDGAKIFYSISKNDNGETICREVKAEFIEDLNKIHEVFASNNTKSVAQLAVEFFQYYFINTYRLLPVIDISKGGFVHEDTDKHALFDIVEPFDSNLKAGYECHKSSFQARSIQKFIVEFCKNLINFG